MENEMKQTAVEWLMEQITYDNGFGQRLNSYTDSVDLSAYFEQAKAMHKEEIMDANFYGQRLHAKSITNTMMEDNAEGYYNETFNK